MSNPATPQPFLKWAGGKRSLLPEIKARIPQFPGRYFEPFLGAGAVMFALDPAIRKVVNDSNVDLIETYVVVRDRLPELLRALRKHQHTKEHYYEVRSWDRKPSFRRRSAVNRAARFIYLNKTCFNGLYRVNADGHFNVPFGDYKNPSYLDAANLTAVSQFLQKKVELRSGDYRGVTRRATQRDFVYFDPPYDPISQTSSFVAYQQNGFGREQQTQLRDEALRLTKRGVPVLLSNANTPFIQSLYADTSVFAIDEVAVKRAISAKASSRKPVSEVLIDNYRAVGKA